MRLADFTNPNLLVPELLNERKESVIAELSKRLGQSGCVKNVRIFSRAVLQHESLVSSVFDQVAFPLARGHTAEELSFAIGLSQYGVMWNKRSALPVYAVVLFAIPSWAASDYLEVAITFSSLLRDHVFFAALRQCNHPDEMFELLSQTGECGTARN